MVRKTLFELVQDHERVDGTLTRIADERVRNLVLHVARADALHTLALRFLAQLCHGVLRVAGQYLAGVQLHRL